MPPRHDRPRRAPALLTLLALLLVAAAAGCSSGDPYEEFDHPRTVRVAPDGRLIVADMGTGENDGRVVAIDAEDQVEVLMDDLPSTLRSGQQHSSLAGPSGADVAPDGTACAAIGWARADRGGEGFATLRCSDGLEVDLEAFEQQANPDGLKLESNPYDVVSDRRGGWYVSDAAANDVLRVSGAGEVQVVATFESLPSGRPDREVQGVPTGLTVAPDGRLHVALFGGAPFGDGTGVVALVDPEAAGDAQPEPELELVARAPYPIAALPTEDGRLAVLSRGVTYDDERGGRILLLPAAGAAGGEAGATSEPETVATGLAAPTGFAQLPDGSFVVAEEPAGRLRRVTPEAAPPATPQGTPAGTPQAR